MTQTSPAILGLGTVVVDHLAVLSAHPSQDTKNAIVRDHMQVGGPVPTALAMLSRLGYHCGFMGRWGDDPFGHMIETDLTREGIDFAGAHVQPNARSGFAHVWVCGETASRTVAYHRPDDGFDLSPTFEAALSHCRALHLDGWPGPAALAAARQAKAHGAYVTLDAGSPKDGMAELIPFCDLLNVPQRFIRQWLGHEEVTTALSQLQALGPRIVTITHGEAGASLACGGERWHQPVPAVQAVDTTGAGDVFSGALVHGLLAQLPPQTMLQWAATAAALKCEGLGNRDALPSRSRIEAAVTEAAEL
jgi:sugar/nucleoside kinase (ribokinase family)